MTIAVIIAQIIQAISPEFFEYFFIVAIAAIIVSKISANSIHRYLLKKDILPYSTKQNLRKFQLKRYANREVTEVESRDNFFYRLSGLAIMIFTFIFAADVESFNFIDQLLFSLGFGLIAAYLLGHRMIVDRDDLLLPNYAISNLQNAMKQIPHMNFGGKPTSSDSSSRPQSTGHYQSEKQPTYATKRQTTPQSTRNYRSEQQPTYATKRQTRSQSLPSNHTDSQPTLATSANYGQTNQQKSSRRNSQKAKKQANRSDVICQNCEEPNPTNASFCQICGESLEM